MSRYYFHIRYDGGLIPDEEGMELRDMRAAHAELAASTADLALAALRAGQCVGNQSVEIEDDAGTLLETMPIRRTLH